MHKLLFTPNTPFDMTDWECRQITKVFAGVNCVMALDENGQTLQKIKNPDLMARTKFWKNITHIALTKCIDGAAIGLVFMWWAIRKGASIMMKAFKKGKISV